MALRTSSSGIWPLAKPALVVCFTRHENQRFRVSDAAQGSVGQLLGGSDFSTRHLDPSRGPLPSDPNLLKVRHRKQQNSPRPTRTGRPSLKTGNADHGIEGSRRVSRLTVSFLSLKSLASIPCDISRVNSMTSGSIGPRDRNMSRYQPNSSGNSMETPHVSRILPGATDNPPATVLSAASTE